MGNVARFAPALLLGLLVCGCAASKNPGASSAAPAAPPAPNSVVLAINSEPSGARVYQGGLLVGKTPCELVYPLEDSSYDTGVMKCQELVVVADGFLPQKAQPCFEVKHEWRPKVASGKNHASVDGGKRYQYGHLFLLERDPKAPVVQQYGAPSPPAANQANTRSTSAAPPKANTASPLDQAQKAGSLLLMLKSLSGH
jgi:hypothetical protein